MSSIKLKELRQFFKNILFIFSVPTTPIQRQVSQTSQPQQTQQKFYVKTAPSAPGNVVKIQQTQKIFVQSSSPNITYVTNQNRQLDDLSHLE